MVSDDIFSIGGKDYGPSPKMQGSWMGQISPSKPRAPTNPWTDLVTNGIGILECFSDGRCPEVEMFVMDLDAIVLKGATSNNM